MARLVKVFTQENCIRCISAKEVGNLLIERKVPVRFYDIETVNGMTEAAFHEVISTPTTIIVDDDDNELESWRGEAPSVEDLEKTLENISPNILFQHEK
jgi:hypothetical protein